MPWEWSRGPSGHRLDWVREGTAPTPDEIRAEDQAIAQELAGIAMRVRDLEDSRALELRRRDALLHYRETRNTLPPLFGKVHLLPSEDGP